MVDTHVTLSGWTLDNPVIPASGCFGYGEEFHELYDINVLGTFSFKGTTLEARFGNPTPRIAECTAGMINAVGLQNPGVHHVIEHELPELKTFFHKKVIANISGFSVAEYEECCRLIDQQEQVGLIEVNGQLPQRTWRRNGVRYLRRKRGGGDARRQGRNDQACYQIQAAAPM